MFVFVCVYGFVYMGVFESVCVCVCVCVRERVTTLNTSEFKYDFVSPLLIT